MTLECEKATVEHYNCNAKGTDPFEITLNEGKGTITIKYCYGTVSSQWWLQRGRLRQFLNRCDDDYILKNLIPHYDKQWFDVEETTVNLKKTILKNRRNRYVDEETAREAYTLIEDLNCNSVSYDRYISEILSHETTMEEALGYGELCTGLVEAVFTYTPHTQFFVKKIFPHVRTVLKEY